MVKLGCDNSLPVGFFGKSLDLLYIPTLEPDPVSKQLDLNAKAIISLRLTSTVKRNYLPLVLDPLLNKSEMVLNPFKILLPQLKT